MALIIHELSTDQEEEYGGMKTIRIVTTDRTHILTMAVTIETSKEMPAFLQLLDAFISKHTTLLPDYRGIKFPVGHMLSVAVTTSKSVSITFGDVESGSNFKSFSYNVPTTEILEMPDPERERGWLENTN